MNKTSVLTTHINQNRPSLLKKLRKRLRIVFNRFQENCLVSSSKITIRNGMNLPGFM